MQLVSGQEYAEKPTMPVSAIDLHQKRVLPKGDSGWVWVVPSSWA